MLKPADVILVTNRRPYSLTDSLSEFTANTADTDTAQLDQSLNTLSDTIDRISPTRADVRRVSRFVANAQRAQRVPWQPAQERIECDEHPVGEHSQQVNSLLLNANDLIGVLQERRYAIVNLLC